MDNLRWPAVLLVFAFLAACGGNGRDVETWPQGDDAYDFENPDAQVVLPDELDEISGLVVLEDGRLAAVQDEDAILYVLDPSTGRIEERRTFGEPADYEAVAVAEGELFVLSSDGRLRRFESWSGEQFEGESVELDLPRRCDAEGLRYHPEDEWLLVACKEYPGNNLVPDKAIFAFDLEGNRVSEHPVHVLDSRAFSASLEDHPANEAVRSVLSDRIDLTGLKPSDLAVHPLTGELFVLSSVREAIVSLRGDGTVTGVWKLDNGLLNQPEGLDFLPNGDLYVSSEAGDRPDAMLARFNYRRPQQQTSE